MNQLEQKQDSILISRFLANRLGYQVGETIILSSYLGRYATSLEIIGFLDSAPGIGLSGFSNPELNQFNRGWLMLNLNFTLNNYKLDFTEIFLASMENSANQTHVEENLRELEAVELVNPNPINRKFIGLFVGKFLPFPRAILLFSGVISFVISMVLVVLVTDYIMTKRRSEYAILIAIGGTRKRVDKLIMTELLFVSFASLLVSTIFGYLISYMALFILRTVYTEKN